MRISNKIWPGFLITLGAACVLPAWAAQAAQPVTVSDKTCLQYGDDAFHAWSQGLYTQVGQHFAPAVAKHLPPSTLRAMWVQLEGEVGKFERFEPFRSRLLRGQPIMIAPVYFASMRMAAIFTCNAQDQITGLQVLDPARIPELKKLLPPPEPQGGE